MTHPKPDPTPAPARWRAVIFDLDGTLVDSLRDIGEAANRTLGKHGLSPHPIARYREFIGEGARRLIERAWTAAGGDPSEPSIDAALASFRQIYAQALTVHTAPYPGICELLVELHRAGVALAILSNKPHRWTGEIARRLFPSIPFRAIHGQRAGIPRKPDPRGALTLCEPLAAQPAQIVFVGDSVVDIDTALAAGMHPVAVTWGFSARKRLGLRGTAHLANNCEELRDLLLAPLER